MGLTLCIVPTYNEAANLRPIVETILAVDAGLELLVVDDCSPDGTGQIAEILASGGGRVNVILRLRRTGLAGAVLAGMAWARGNHYNRVISMDADFSHAPEEIPRLLEGAATADLVIGSRYCVAGRICNWSRRGRYLSQAGGWYVRAVTKLPLNDPTSGFRCFNERALRLVTEMPLLSRGFSVHFEMAHRIWQGGLRIAEVPITYRGRRTGRSKLNLAILLEALAVAARLRFAGSAPYKLTGNEMTQSP